VHWSLEGQSSNDNNCGHNNSHETSGSVSRTVSLDDAISEVQPSETAAIAENIVSSDVVDEEYTVLHIKDHPLYLQSCLEDKKNNGDRSDGISDDLLDMESANDKPFSASTDWGDFESFPSLSGSCNEDDQAEPDETNGTEAKDKKMKKERKFDANWDPIKHDFTG